MASNSEKFVAEILLNTREAQDKIKRMQEDMEVLRKKQKDALRAGDTKTYNECEKAINRLNGKIAKQEQLVNGVNKVLGNMSTAKMKELEASINHINKALNSGSVERNSKEWNILVEKMREAKRELRNLRDATGEHQGAFQRMVHSMNKNWGAITQGFALFAGVRMTILKTVDDYAKMEEAMADTRKYTGLTDAAIRELNEDLKKIDTRTGREELNELAGVAGRLGITSKDAILEFVDAANQIKVALGDDLGEGAIDKVGKLAMAFGEDEKMGLRGAMLATGSAVNELAQNSSAQAGYLVDFTARVAGFGKQLGLTQAQIMGFGAVMDENLLRDEMAATAFGNMLTKMQLDTAKFAKIAGMDVKQFTDLLNKDANAAILALADSLKKADPQSMMKMLDDMGLDGSRAVGVLSTLADKIDDVRARQELATKAYAEGTSVQKEYNTMNNTVQAEIEKAKKRFHELSVELGERLQPIVKYTIGTANAMLKVIKAIIDFVPKHIILISTIAATLAILNARRLYGITMAKLEVLWNGKAAMSFRELALAIKANPWGLAITALATFIGLLADAINLQKKNEIAAGTMANANKKAAEQFENERTKIEFLNKQIHNNNLGYDTRKKMLDELKEIVPGYHADLEKEKGLINDNTEALEEYLKNLEKSIKLEAAQEELKEAYKKKRTLEKRERDLNKDLNKANAGLSTARINATVQAQSLGTQGMRNLSTGMDMATKNAEDRVANVKSELDDVHRELSQTNKDVEELNSEITTTSIEIEKTKKDNGGGGNSNTNPTNYVTDSERTKKEAEEAKAEAERLKKLREADKAEKAITDQRLAENILNYQAGLQTYREFTEKQAKIQEEGLKARMKVWEKEPAEYAKYQKQLAALQFKGDNERRKMDQQDLERSHIMWQQMIEEEFQTKGSALYRNEDAYRERMFQEEIAYLEDKKALTRKGSLEEMQIEWEIQDKENQHKLQKNQEYRERYSKYLEEMGKKDLDELQQLEMNGAKAMFDLLKEQGLMTQEEYDAVIEHIKRKYAELKGDQKADNDIEKKAASGLETAKKNAGTKAYDAGDNAATGLFSITNAIQNQQAINDALKDLYGEDYENNKEYQEAKRQLENETMQQIVAGAQAAYSTISNFMSAASSYAQACSDLEVARITKNYDQQIAAAGKNEKKREKLEKEKEKAIAKVKTEANAKAMKMEIAQAIVQSALGALSAYTSTMKGAPYPANLVLAPISAGLALAAGAIQIATIKKQHEAEAEGYYEGGFTGGRMYRKEAGVVHEGEFVANHQAVNNPNVRPMLQLLDQAQRNNTVGSLTADDISRQLGQSGAAVVAPVVNVNSDNEELRGTMEQMQDTNERLAAAIEAGIKAYVTIDGPDGVKKKLDDYNRLINNK